jgi:hypothetical protein
MSVTSCKGWLAADWEKIRARLALAETIQVVAIVSSFSATKPVGKDCGERYILLGNVFARKKFAVPACAVASADTDRCSMERRFTAYSPISFDMEQA